MRKIAFIPLVVFFLASVSLCSKVSFKEKAIKLGVSMWTPYGIAYVAEEKGFFVKNGVNVEIIFSKQLSDLRQLFGEGQLDGYFSTFVDVISDADMGVKSKVVYILDYSDTGDVIIAKPSIRSLSGLKGKTISFEDFNSFSHIFVLKALASAGVTESNARFKIVRAHDVLDELEKNEIDAGHTWEPTKSQAIAKGYRALAKASDFPGIIADVVAFTPHAIAKRAKEVEAIVKSLADAVDFTLKNKEEAAKIISEKMGITYDEALNGLSGAKILDAQMNEAALKDAPNSIAYIDLDYIKKFLSERGQMYTNINFNDVVDKHFITK